MSLRPAARRHASAAVTTVFGLLAASVLVGIPASAESDAAPGSERTEDSRADVREGGADTCEVFGGGLLVGVSTDEVVTNLPDLLYEGGAPGIDRHVRITDVPEGITVTAVVVQGGLRHNVYLPGRRGLATTAPWMKLRAPLNDDGGVVPISHWFACGEETPTELSEPEPEGEAMESDSAGATGAEGFADSPAPTSSPTSDGRSSTTSPAVASPHPQNTDPAIAAEGDDLASTGFGGGWLVPVGVALLSGGAALLALARLRRR